MLETFGRYRQLAKIFLVQAAGLGVAFEHKRMEIQAYTKNKRHCRPPLRPHASAGGAGGVPSALEY